jgi:hypothetical protein
VTFLAMASKFEPRPESRMPRFFIRAFSPTMIIHTWLHK